MSESLAAQLDVRLAWNRVLDDLGYRTFVQFPFEVEMIELNLGDWLGDVVERIRADTYTPVGSKHHPRIVLGQAPGPTVNTPRATSPQGSRRLASARPTTATSPPSVRVRPCQRENSVWDAVYPGQAAEILAELEAAAESERLEEHGQWTPPPGSLGQFLLGFVEACLLATTH